MEILEAEVSAPVRGRPREFNADEALAAALQVFWKHGYEGASLTDLTEAMGITRPSLYACFGNKEALFRKALDLYEREKLAYMGRALEAPTARGVVERLLRGGLAMQTSGKDPHGCLNVISTVACSQGAESMREEIIARRASTEKVMRARMQKAVEDGDFPPGIEADAICNYLMTMLQGMAVRAGAGASRDELEQAVETFLTVWPGR